MAAVGDHAFYAEAPDPKGGVGVLIPEVERHRLADLPVEDKHKLVDPQWLGREDDEVKPNALHEFRAPAGVIITYNLNERFAC